MPLPLAYQPTVCGKRVPTTLLICSPGSTGNVLSFSEARAHQLVHHKWEQLMAYNQRQLTRVYPSAYRIDSSNFNPLPYWNAGCQLGGCPRPLSTIVCSRCLPTISIHCMELTTAVYPLSAPTFYIRFLHLLFFFLR